MTVFILTINNYPCRDNTLTEVFASRDKAITRMEEIYNQFAKDPMAYNGFMEENQGIYTCGWIHASQYLTEGTIVEREIQ